MIKLFVTVLLSIPVVLTTLDDQGYEINEGYIYHEETQSNKIEKDKLIKILQEDSNKVWTNCFSDNSQAKEKLED